MTTPQNHYVNANDFSKQVIGYKRKCAEAKAEGKPTPKIPDSIGYIFMEMARRMATKPNFSGYTYKDEMIDESLLHCVKAIHNFDPEKGNAFSYFSRIIWQAFLIVMKKEKMQQKSKEHLLNDVMLQPYDLIQSDEGTHYENIDITIEDTRLIYNN